MNTAVLVDIASASELVNAFPVDTEVTNYGNGFYYASYEDYQLFAKRVFSNQTRWVAVLVGETGILAWLKSRLGDAKAKKITKEFYQANEAAMNAIGFNPVIRDGIAYIKLPHVICGQSPWVQVSDE